MTLGNVISGLGSVSQNGTAAVTLTANNTYYGPTTISAGTLQIGNGGSGASIGNTSGVLDNGSFDFVHADAVAFAPMISGTGNLIQAGTGTLALTGYNTYSGTTTVSAGTLEVGNGTSGEFLASPAISVSGGAAWFSTTPTRWCIPGPSAAAAC